MDPVPFLLGLACAASIGSAATLIGNPQNMVIQEHPRARALVLGLHPAAAPVMVGLLVSWLIVAVRSRPLGRDFHGTTLGAYRRHAMSCGGPWRGNRFRIFSPATTGFAKKLT